MDQARVELISSYVEQLSHSLGGVNPLADKDELKYWYDRGDYAALVGCIQKAMRLNLRIRLGYVNSGGPAGAPAWVFLPNPMPLFGSSDFQKLQVEMFLRKSFLEEANFELVVMASSHELSHIVLSSIGHALKAEEVAVDLTAMILGYRDIFVLGHQKAEPFNMVSEVMAVLFAGHGSAQYRSRWGYLTPEEARFASKVMERFSRS